jgi:hypothetical protein
MSGVLDPKLYAQSIRRINVKYGTQTSAYRSMAIVKDYKKNGGRYTPRIKGKDQGVSKWLLEKWVVVIDFLNGKSTTCGTGERRRHACRPSVKVDRKTPVTIQEVIQTHGRRKVASLALNKSRGSENVRIDWKNGKQL